MTTRSENSLFQQPLKVLNLGLRGFADDLEHAGGEVVLSIVDDGKGMQAERIRAKAVEKGLISEEEANTLDERQSLNLIFLPGFSTKTQISDVSGRGVGMDVVKRNVEKMGGRIAIYSEVGKGSCFTLRVPATVIPSQ